MINTCEKCYLSISNRYMAGRGAGCTPTSAYSVMFVGDAPTISEYKTQTLFNGRSNKLISKFIDEYKLTAWSIKTNLIKCVCSNPTEYYADKCYHNFVKELQYFNPTIIVAVGKFVYQFLKEENYKSMTSLVNKPIKFNKSILIPIYSPAYITKNKCYSEYVKSFELISNIFAELCTEYRYYISE